MTGWGARRGDKVMEYLGHGSFWRNHGEGLVQRVNRGVGTTDPVLSWDRAPKTSRQWSVSRCPISGQKEGVCSVSLGLRRRLTTTKTKGTSELPQTETTETYVTAM